MESKGAPKSLTEAMCRLQMLPNVLIAVADREQSEVQGRTSGSLTGSRIAGQAARVPVLEALQAKRQELDKLAFKWKNSDGTALKVPLPSPRTSTICSTTAIVSTTPSKCKKALMSTSPLSGSSSAKRPPAHALQRRTPGSAWRQDSASNGSKCPH